MPSIGIGIGVAKAATGGLSGTVTVSDPGTCYAGVATTVTVTASASITRVVLTEVGVGTVWDDSATPFSGAWTPSTSGSRTLHADGYAGAVIVATDDLVVSVGTLIQAVAACGVPIDSATVLLLPHLGVTESGGFITQVVDQISGYVFTPQGGNVPATPAQWGSRPVFDFDVAARGEVALVCTNATLLAAYSGTNVNEVIVAGHGRSVGASATNAVAGFCRSSGGTLFTLGTDTSSRDGLIRGGVSLYADGAVGFLASAAEHCYFAVGNYGDGGAGTTSFVRRNGVEIKSGTTSYTGTAAVCAIGCLSTGEAIYATWGWSGPIGPVLIFKPASIAAFNAIDWGGLQRLFRALGYGAGGLCDSEPATVYAISDLHVLDAGPTNGDIAQKYVMLEHQLEAGQNAEAVAFLGDLCETGNATQFANLSALYSGVVSFDFTGALPWALWDPGNHEMDTDGDGSTAKALFTGMATAMGANLWGYVDLPSCRFVALLYSAEWLGDVAAQTAWYPGVLASATKPVFRACHWPVFNITDYMTVPGDEQIQLQWHEAERLATGKQIIVCEGHKHGYGQLYPQTLGVRDDTNGILWAMTGNAGGIYTPGPDASTLQTYTYGGITYACTPALCYFTGDVTMATMTRLNVTAAGAWRVRSYDISTGGVATLSADQTGPVRS